MQRLKAHLPQSPDGGESSCVQSMWQSGTKKSCPSNRLRSRLARMRRPAIFLLTVVLMLPCATNAQEWAKTRLDASPRHREYVTLKHGDRSLQAFVVYPE